MIHTVVPIARAHKRQAVRTGGQTLVERERAVLEQACFPFGNRRLEKDVALFLTQDRSLKEGNHLGQNSGVACNLNILGDGISKPDTIISHARAYAAI